MLGEAELFEAVAPADAFLFAASIFLIGGLTILGPLSLAAAGATGVAGISLLILPELGLEHALSICAGVGVMLLVAVLAHGWRGGGDGGIDFDGGDGGGDGD